MNETMTGSALRKPHLTLQRCHAGSVPANILKRKVERVAINKSHFLHLTASVHKKVAATHDIPRATRMRRLEVNICIITSKLDGKLTLGRTRE